MKKPGEYGRLLRSLGGEWKWLMQYVLRYKLQIALYVLLGVAGTLMGLGVSVTTKYLIDAVISHNSGTIGLCAAGAVGMAAAQLLLGTVTGRISAVVGTRVSTEIRSEIFSHILGADWEQVREFHSGELLNRLEGDANAISGSIVSFIPALITRATQFVGCLAIVLWYDPTMAAFALISAPVLVLISRYSAKMMRTYNQESREMNGKILSESQETIQNLQTLKAFDLTRDQVRKFRALLEDYRSLRLHYNRFSLRLSLGLGLLGLVVSYSCYGWGVWRLWQGAITFGTMTMFLQLAGQLTGSFSVLVSLAPSVISIATSAGRIMEVTQLPAEQDARRDQALRLLPRALARGLTVRAENLTYTYPDSLEPVLRQVTFEAGPGETVAFVGPSGEGKTTLLRLLLGLIRPGEGSLTVTVGEETMDISDSTRRLCTYVPQGAAILSGTVADNLRVVCPAASDRDLWKALEIADARDFVEALPDQLQSPMGERGVNFSEGQLQRLSIARALLRQAPILILDEATSALDEATEQRVLQGLMASDPARTCILTTHRPSVLHYCRRVYEIDNHGAVLRNESSR